MTKVKQAHLSHVGRLQGVSARLGLGVGKGFCSSFLISWGDAPQPHGLPLDFNGAPGVPGVIKIPPWGIPWGPGVKVFGPDV